MADELTKKLDDLERDLGVALDRVRELEAALADALYWLKPDMDKRAMERDLDRDDLVKILHKKFTLPGLGSDRTS
jgi:hypothetical protein